MKNSFRSNGLLSSLAYRTFLCASLVAAVGGGLYQLSQWPELPGSDLAREALGSVDWWSLAAVWALSLWIAWMAGEARKAARGAAGLDQRAIGPYMGIGVWAVDGGDADARDSAPSKNV